MADVKISALPAATTPLGGTEVLPIVQSSTTKKVSIADVTAGRAVSASSLTLTTPLGVASGGTGLTSLTAGYIPFGGSSTYSSDSSLFWDNMNKYLGIGTASPTARLNISGGDLFVERSDYPILALYRSSTRQGYLWSVAGSYLELTADSRPLLMSATGANYISSYTNGSERMRITSGGLVGIGTTSPDGNLHLNTTGNTTIVVSAGDTGLSRFVFQGQVANYRGFIDYDNTSTVRALIFRTDEAERLRITKDGWVQIQNASAPGSNPSSSGYLYVESGALKYRGSSGTVTTIANA